jgi:hypothetical protein
MLRVGCSLSVVGGKMNKKPSNPDKPGKTNLKLPSISLYQKHKIKKWNEFFLALFF